MSDSFNVFRPPTRWCLTTAPVSRPIASVVCLPPAGTGASIFQPWGAALAANRIELRAIQYPGHETRLNETPRMSISDLTREIVAEWPSISRDVPCFLFGHSMGALLAYELTLALVRASVSNRPSLLFLSGRAPPHIASRIPKLAHLADLDFVNAVARLFGSIPPEVQQDQDAIRLICRALRADFALLEKYRAQPSAQIKADFFVLGGTNDPWASKSELSEWARYTTHKCTQVQFDGDHFFFRHHPEAITGLILSEVLRRV